MRSSDSSGSSGVSLPAIIASVLERAQNRPLISLEEVAEAVGAAPVSMPDIEAIFDALEAAGRSVEAELKDAPAALARVLSTVRSFTVLNGRRPTVSEIGQHSGLGVGEVRFALLYSRVLAP